VRNALHRAGAARLPAAALLACAVALALGCKAGAQAPAAAAEIPLRTGQAAPGRTAAIDQVRRLQAQLAQQPRDARAWAILARLQFEMDRYSEAAMAYERALALPSRVADDAAVWCEYADALGMTQAGELNGRPRELIARALALDPNHPKALEMAGSADYAQGNYASALRYWRPLLAALEPGSQMHQELAAAVARSERLALMAPATPRR
jgi:cytochrome c-type biogenesis protein CcmH